MGMVVNEGSREPNKGMLVDEGSCESITDMASDENIANSAICSRKSVESCTDNAKLSEADAACLIQWCCDRIFFSEKQTFTCPFE